MNTPFYAHICRDSDRSFKPVRDFMRATIADSEGREIAFVPELGDESTNDELRQIARLFEQAPVLAKLVQEVHDHGRHALTGTWFARAQKALQTINFAATETASVPPIDERTTERPVHYHDTRCFQPIDGTGDEAVYEVACGKVAGEPVFPVAGTVEAAEFATK